MSGSRAELTQDRNALANFEITREQLLEQDEENVGSTTDSEDTPVKKRKVSKKVDSLTKSKTIARAVAAKGRAMSIFKQGQSSSFAEAGRGCVFSMQ